MSAPSRIVLSFVSVLVLALSLGACRRGDRCVPVCEQRAKELGCSSQGGGCKATCEQLHAPVPCAAAFRAWEACILNLPTNQWQCDEHSGEPIPKMDACPTERKNVEKCIESPPAPPPK
jgi:hypothetical protein